MFCFLQEQVISAVCQAAYENRGAVQRGTDEPGQCPLFFQPLLKFHECRKSCLYTLSSVKRPCKIDKNYPNGKYMKFETYHINTTLKKNLAAQGFHRPTDIQYKAIPSILNGEDVLAIAQTGTGKTVAFAVPVINALQSLKGPKKTNGDSMHYHGSHQGISGPRSTMCLRPCATTQKLNHMPFMGVWNRMRRFGRHKKGLISLLPRLAVCLT